MLKWYYAITFPCYSGVNSQRRMRTKIIDVRRQISETFRRKRLLNWHRTFIWIASKVTCTSSNQKIIKKLKYLSSECFSNKSASKVFTYVLYYWHQASTQILSQERCRMNIQNYFRQIHLKSILIASDFFYVSSKYLNESSAFNEFPPISCCLFKH